MIQDPALASILDVQIFLPKMVTIADQRRSSYPRLPGHGVVTRTALSGGLYSVVSETSPHLLLCPAMDYLWTPWRYAYVSAPQKTSECIFCELPKLGDDVRARIVYRGQYCYIGLNTYPYTPGHVMVVPFAHLDELQKLPVEASHEMMELSQKMEQVLRRLYKPDGINLGMNIGKAAGAGVAGHIHMHALPRWVADANFVSVVGETRILPETLDVTYERIKGGLQSAVSS
jgi:ATP adenylyltransferase